MIKFLSRHIILLAVIIGLIASFYFGSSLYLVGCMWLGSYFDIVMMHQDQITINVKQEQLIREQDKAIKALKENSEWNRFVHESHHLTRKLALGDSVDLGVLKEITVTHIHNLEDDKLPLTRTFHISLN